MFWLITLTFNYYLIINNNLNYKILITWIFKSYISLFILNISRSY
jgi:hypothetical protein